MSQGSVSVPPSSNGHAAGGHAPSSRAALVLGALGVVYGDIGTSPLYTLRACLTGLSVHTDLEPAHLLGVLSILFWMLMVVVSFKYVTLVLRA
ncbi:KUP/HAK/KT family potassium transporter, partial [Achromobacter xylosoxidans]|nr:KUP/HAK/KT family potassium transporter [Achromobacter xylosoxidans]